MRNVLVLVCLAAAAASCCRIPGIGKDEDPGPVPITAPSEPKSTTTVQLTAQPAPTPAPTPAAAPNAYAPDGLPVDIPASRSAVPTVAEWNAVPREINVARSTPLNCETKMLREWLRVSCRPKSSTGGTPTNVVHKSGPKDNAYYFAKGEVASLVVPVTRGKHMESTFSWTDKTQTLVLDWPGGAPRPIIKFTD
jgi:hypothetical protein